jgi:transposase InsO family protein
MTIDPAKCRGEPANLFAVYTRVKGWEVSLRSNSGDWKKALAMVINGEFPYWVRGQGLQLISDNGSQPMATLL